jgi:hypothetical protein
VWREGVRHHFGVAPRMGFNPMAVVGNLEWRDVPSSAQHDRHRGVILGCRVQTLSDLPNGGQVMLDEATFKGVHNSLMPLGEARMCVCACVCVSVCVCVVCV